MAIKKSARAAKSAKMCCCTKKTAAIWLSGLFAAGAICHAALAITGKVVTIETFGITLTRNVNIAAFIIVAAISVLLCSCGCRKK